MLRLFAILSTLALVLIAALVAHAQDGKQKLSIGQCYKTFNCSFSEKGTDVQGFRNGNNHVGCNGFVNTYRVYTVCTSGDCSSQCSDVEGGFNPGSCIASNNEKDIVGCVKM